MGDSRTTAERCLATRILGIDPGTDTSNYVVFDGHAVLDRGLKVPNDSLEEALLARDIEFDLAGIEQICSYGMAVGKEVFATCHWTGRLLLACNLAHQGEVTTLVPRLDVKLCLCHSAKARDANVRQALIDRWGRVGTKKDPGPLYGVSSHLWAALGVAHWMLTVKTSQPAPIGTGTLGCMTSKDASACTQHNNPTARSTSTGRCKGQRGQ